MREAIQSTAGGPETAALAGASAVARRGVVCAVRRLVLTDFRNFASLRLAPETRPVVLTGANGAGKTNLLEAVSFLVPGKGLRDARLGEVDRRDAPQGAAWAVAATLDTPEGRVDIGTGRDPASPRDPSATPQTEEAIAAPERGGSRRLVRIDGVPVRGTAALAEMVSAVWLTPAMDRLFAEGAGGRRRFLDRVVYGFDASHAGRVWVYERALRGRARLLRHGSGDGRPQGSADQVWLAALEESMAATGVAVAAARREMVARLNVACAQENGPFPGAQVEMAGEVDGWLDEGPALEAEERLRAALLASRARDAESGGAARGPHRSDLVVRHRAKDTAAGLCSTGEQKALLISIILAVAKLNLEDNGAPPLLLLDEVAAHLDCERRDALFGRLGDLGVQAWITGTDKALFRALHGRAQFFHVANGAVVPC